MYMQLCLTSLAIVLYPVNSRFFLQLMQDIAHHILVVIHIKLHLDTR